MAQPIAENYATEKDSYANRYGQIDHNDSAPSDSFYPQPSKTCKSKLSKTRKGVLMGIFVKVQTVAKPGYFVCSRYGCVHTVSCPLDRGSLRYQASVRQGRMSRFLFAGHEDKDIPFQKGIRDIERVYIAPRCFVPDERFQKCVYMRPFLDVAICLDGLYGEPAPVKNNPHLGV